MIRLSQHSRLLYIHAYQSYVWNLAVTERIQKYGMVCVEGDLVSDSDFGSVEIDEEVDTKVDMKLDAPVEEAADNSFQKVPALSGKFSVSPVSTKEEASKLDIRSVVLPLPGSAVILPSNSLAEFYTELLAQDGLNLSSFHENTCKEYNSSGAYRRIVQSPSDFEFSVFPYDDSDMELAATELTGMRSDKSASRESGAPATTTTGVYHAVNLKFTLPPGTYATMLLRELTKASTDFDHQSALTQATNARVAAAGGDEGECGGAEDMGDNKRARLV